MDEFKGEGERGGHALIDRLRRYLPGDWDILSVVLLLALALRIYFALAFNVRFLAGYDEDFVAAASGPLPAGDGAPLYPAFLKTMNFLSGGRLSAAYIMQAVLDSAAVMLLLYAGTWLLSRKAGIIAAVLAALYPGFLLNTISPTPAAAVVFLATALIAAGAAVDRGKIRPMTGSVLSAVAAATGILTEPSFVFFVPGLLAVSRRKVVFLLVLAGILLPWTLRNSIVERTPVPLYRTEVWKIDLDKFRADDPMGFWRTVKEMYENASLLTSRGWAVNPDEAATVEERNSTYTAAYSYIVIMALGVIGLAKLYGSRTRSASLPFIIYYLLLILFTIFTERYRTALEPLLLLYAGILTAELFRRRSRDLPETADDPHQEEG